MTSGGDPGTNGAQRRLALVMALGFAVILTTITIGNAESTISDFAAAGVRESTIHIWIWQVTSVLSWVSVMPLIWVGVARLRPPRFGWPVVALAAAAGVVLASGWHIAVMIGLRHLAYAALGDTYQFEGGLSDPYLYEFRKDLATYLQFVAVALGAQWLLARAGAAEPVPNKGAAADHLEVNDGRVTHRIPLDTIDYVAAAGNYVEVGTEGRVLLHRATLASVEGELGPNFVRIHRSRIVRRAAIRKTEVDRSGDFTITLSSGELVRGSRRYREVA
jgi:DNA-binding LytR/AlgR family response regulator